MDFLLLNAVQFGCAVSNLGDHARRMTKRREVREE